MQSIDHRRARNWISVCSLVAFIAVGVFAYPYIFLYALPRFGVSPIAVALLFAAALSFAVRGRSWAEPMRRGAAPSIGIPILLAVAAFGGDSLYLQLVPSVVYLTLASWFYASLQAGDSIVERAARFLVPEAPDFIRPYCRKVTGLWAVFFAAIAIATAALAFTEERSWWEFVTGKLVYALMMAVSLIEFLVRKTWFRYYFHRGWFDRVWGKIFPPENTAEGRRSMQHIAEYWKEHNS